MKLLCLADGSFKLDVRATAKHLWYSTQIEGAPRPSRGWVGIWMDGLMDGSHSWVPKQGSGLIGGQKVCSDKRCLHVSWPLQCFSRV